MQAEKSARMEAEARCAAALEALRQAGGPNSRAASQVAGSALPVKLAEKAQESIAEARGLVASMCTLLEGKLTCEQRATMISQPALSISALTALYSASTMMYGT